MMVYQLYGYDIMKRDKWGDDSYEKCCWCNDAEGTLWELYTYVNLWEKSQTFLGQFVLALFGQVFGFAPFAQVLVLVIVGLVCFSTF